MIGYDSGKQLKDAIRPARSLGAISQDPVGIGYKCVDAADEGDQGREVAQDHRHRLPVVRQDNIDEPEMQPLLYD